MSALRVYVAGASAEVDLVSSYIDRLRSGGVHITHDWTPEVKVAIAAGRKDVDCSLSERLGAVRRDYAAIASADMMWLIVPIAQTIGAWAELGYAHGVNTPVVASGHNASCTIFTDFCWKAPSHDFALGLLLELNRVIS